MKIFGITGTNGSGKGTMVDYLKLKGFKHHSVRAFLEEVITAKKLPVNRDTMRIVANELRSNHGGDYILRTLRKRAQDAGEDLVIIESIRTVDEVNTLVDKIGGTLFSIDADQEKRYKRILKRGLETDKVSFDTFKEQERKESESTKPTEQNLFLCRRLTHPDFQFTNNGGFTELYKQIDHALAISAPALRY